MQEFRAAVFDLDGTIVGIDLFAAWCRRHFSRRPIGFIGALLRRDFIRATLSANPRDAFKSCLAASCLRSRISAAELDLELAEFIGWALAEHVSKHAITEIEKHRRAGRLLVLATGSLHIYAAPIGHALGFHETVATQADPVVGPANSGIVGNNIRGIVKRDAVQRCLHAHGLSLQADAVSYADSISDFPLLESSAGAVLVNPSPRTAKAATRRKFVIANWHDSQ